ncbi:MAG: ABC transporter permease [Pseudomonadota bacterium]
MPLALFPFVTLALLLGPIIAGLAATFLPAFGYFPALGGDSFSLGPFSMLWDQPGLWKSAWLSIKVGVISTALALAITALFLAGWHSTRSFRAVQGFISPLLSVPHAAAAFGIAFLLAPSGWLMRLASPELTGFTRPPIYLFPGDEGAWALILGMTVKELPFLILMSLAAWPQLRADKKLQVAAGLGYGRVAGFLHSVWPQLYGQVRLAVFAVLAFAASVVDVALILGPSTPPTLPVRLLDWMNDPDLSRRFLASAGAVLQLGLVLAAMAMWLAMEKLGSLMCSVLANSGRRMTRDGFVRRGALAITVSLVATVVFGTVVLGLWSVAGFWRFPDALPQALTLKSWSSQSSQALRVLGNTFVIGGLAVVVAAVLTIGCLEREHRSGRDGGQRALLLLYVPLLVPQIAFVFGLQMFALSLGIDTSLAAVVLVHLVFVLPYLFLSLSDPWRNLDPRFAQVGAGMGHGPNVYLWRVRLPLLLRAILTAAAVGFSVSIAQYLPTLLIGGGRLPTVTTEAVALASGGNRRIIGVFAFLQLVAPLVGFLIAALVPAFLFRNRREMRP